MTNREIVAKLSMLDLSNYPYPQIHELIRNVEKIGVLVYKMKPGKFVTRGRLGHGFTKKTDLSYKPQNLNTKCQRASTPNSTMFYGSIVDDRQNFIDTRGMAIAECSTLARTGIYSSGIEKITFGKWEVTKDIELISIIPMNEYSNIENNPLLTELRKIYNRFISLDKDNKDNHKEIIDFLFKEFCKTNIRDDYDYLISAVFSEVITNDFNYDGILYPSVRMGGQYGFNVAIKPNVVDNCLELDVVGESIYFKNKEKGICIVERDGKYVLNKPITYINVPNRPNNEYILKELGINNLQDLKI